jgi:hypothetical protein
MSGVDNGSVCTGDRDWDGELDRIGKVMEAVGDRERGAGVEHESPVDELPGIRAGGVVAVAMVVSAVGVGSSTMLLNENGMLSINSWNYNTIL